VQTSITAENICNPNKFDLPLYNLLLVKGVLMLNSWKGTAGMAETESNGSLPPDL